MRRTYKSKKDVGGGLDPRDMITHLDDKESAFEAFYIQNIKQTKREQSCMGASNNHGAASNRVRKRKNLKRVAKAVEPSPLKSLSGSVFLTPDKSIRVNKVQDLFDQLLNSSPAYQEAKLTKKEDPFDRLLTPSPKPKKSYMRKKKPACKNISFSSSSSSGSDKENESNKTSSVQNATDIISHELVIEKEPTPSHKIDESINNIVRKLTLLNNKRSSDHGSLKKTFKCNKNRLTKNFQSPLEKGSPLSSTPFIDKSRSQSIYKFSPIPMRDLEDSLNYVTIREENDEVNKSIVFVPKIKSNSLKRSKNDCSVSPVIQFNKDFMKSKEDSKSLFSSEAGTTEDSKKSDDLKTSNYLKCLENKDSNFVELSSIQTSEIEPFLGFNPNKKDNILISKEDQENSIIISTGKTSKTSDRSKESVDSYHRSVGHSNETVNDSQVQNIQNVTEYKTGKGIDNYVDSLILSQDISIPSRSFRGFTQIDENTELHPEAKYTVISKNTCSEESNESALNATEDKCSIYDTCSSEGSLNEDMDILSEPVVVVERLDKDLFNNYYSKMPQYDSEDEEKCIKNDINSLSEDVSYESCDRDEDLSPHTENDVLSISSQSDPEVDSIMLESDLDHSYDKAALNNDLTVIESNVKEKRCISFVTTRRKHEYQKKSTIFVSDDSEISSDNEKTVISNIISTSPRDFVDTSPVNLKNHNKDTKAEYKRKVSVSPNPGVSNVTIRKSRLFAESSCIPKDTEDFIMENKPAIILEPGKKWERSLSIYRRMTMATDHFDQSILENENLQNKGRKYRMSVIHTMEMQEKGSLHNESIHSRRSTFVPKPSRSTIRIVKDTSNTRLSLSNTTVFDDLKGFIEDCDDTIVELSKLSIADERDVTIVEKFNEDCRIATAKDYVLRRCNQSETIPFDECYPDPLLKNCRKIGEGVYGEVYLWRAPDGRARVMKVVPIAGDTRVNGEQQKDYHEIISEIVIAMELSALRTPITEIENHLNEGKDCDTIDLHSVENATDVFNEVLAVRCVFGPYSSRLLDLWELYDESRGSENDNPAVLPPDQQYIVLELANAGQDLESYRFTNAEQAYALFWQVAFALAVGEEAFQFEHRDLHWGNVLIAPTDQEYATFVLRGRLHRVPRRGVAATIIDYSLSRVSLPLGRAADCAALYNDLARDEALFAAAGDYQFEVYRLMRDRLRNDWKTFEPYTNILWLHYVVDKMVTALRYERTTSRTHKTHLNKLRSLRERILSYDSAAQFVITDQF